MAKSKPTDNPRPSRTLRERAEEMLTTSHTDINGMSADEIRKLVHELQVHQMELEIQNEDLREAQIEIAHSRDRYSDLYEFAPVGYLSLDRHGVIEEANLTAATMLGGERKDLAKRKLTDFLPDDAQEPWHFHRRAVFSDETKKSCELPMKPADGNPITVVLESLAFRDEDGSLSGCRTALIDVTTVKLARQQLEESERRYRRLTDAVTDYVYHVRVERGRAVETLHGPNCVAVTGYTPEEFAANSLLWIAMVPTEDHAIVEQQAADILADRYSAPIEHRIQRKDGQIRWVLDTVSPQHDDGNLIAFDGLVRDITERRVAEEALRELNETLEKRGAEQTGEIRLLATAMSNLGEGVAITDDHFDWPGPEIVYVNEAMCRITGYTADELIGQTPRILQGDKTDRRTIERLRHALSEKHPHLCELVNYRKDGTPYDAELFVTPLFDSEGNHTNFIAIHRDITERKQAEQALQRTQFAIDNSHDAIFWIGPDGRLLFVNDAACELSGYPRGELSPKTVVDFDPDLSADEWPQWWERIKAEGAVTLERRFISKNDHVFAVEVFANYVKHQEEEFLCTFVRDITERNKLQRDVLGIAEDEQRRIGQDLHDSTQQELAGLGMLAQTLLDNLSKAPGDLPKSGAPDTCELATKVVEGIARTHREVQTISRGLVPIRLDSPGLMDALRELASRTDDLEGVTCAFKCEQPVEIADSLTATHLYRIAQEAITNALKHGRPEHILIALESDDGHPVLQVADDGPGFDATEKSEGMGLKTMRYRAGLIGASVTLSPVETGGTLVRCQVYRGG